MRSTKIITGNAYFAVQKKQNFFSKEELNLILSLYGKGVSSGKWKDYAIDASKDETIFRFIDMLVKCLSLKLQKIIKVKRLMKGG